MNTTTHRMHVPGSPLRPLAGQLLLLAPSRPAVPARFRNLVVDQDFHDHLLAEVQRLRGGVYVRDEAITATQLDAEGRHRVPVDAHSWHIVALQPNHALSGCARYRVHPPDVRPEHLGVWSSAIARHPSWRAHLATAVTGEIELARRRKVGYVEVGGWAIDEACRFTADGLTVALSTYALARSLGGCLGLTTATIKNCSSRILRKIGGRPVETAGLELPSYYDPQYRCEMEILRFDSATLNPRLEAHVAALTAGLADVPVICAESAVPVHRAERAQVAATRVEAPALRAC